MPLPMSRTQLDKLGDRLASTEPTSDEDWEKLEEVVACYQSALDEVQASLEGLGYEPTSRTKSTGTLIDKLRRNTSFKTVADVAGARMVIEGGRNEQDRAVAAICAAFEPEGSSRPPKVLDRREAPSEGYRAVHVIVHHDGLPVEIQVRTRLQDLWAQIVERLGDTWGRELRYGEPLRDADRPCFPGSRFTRQEFVANLMSASALIDRVETWEAQLPNGVTDVEITVPGVDPEELDSDWRTLSGLRERLLSWLDDLDGLVKGMKEVS